MADTEAAEGPGVGHEQRSRIGGRWERRSYPLTSRRSTQRNQMQLHDAQGKRLYLTAEERSTRPSGAARGIPTSRSGRGAAA